jgi:hypothetical protein
VSLHFITDNFTPSTIEQEITTDIYLYRFHKDSFNAFLREHHLIFHYDLLPTMQIINLIPRIIDDMHNSPLAYQFGGPSQGPSSSYLPHETQALQLLGLVNKGCPRPSDQQVRLRKMPIQQGHTVDSLARDRTYFANPNMCIDDGRFVLHFRKS